MAVWSYIQKPQLEGALRLDAEYYQPKYLDVRDKLLKLKYTREINNFAKVLRGKTPTRYTGIGVPIIRAVNLRDLTNLEDMFYADEKKKLFYLKLGDVLISSIGEGSIGKVEIFTKGNRFATVSEVSVIRSTYNPFFLVVFLKTKYGYLQLERRITGSTGQLHLYPKDIVTVLVPNLPDRLQKGIENLLRYSIRLSEESKELYLKAEQMVLNGVGFGKINFHFKKSFIVNLSEVKSAHRADAEYFQPKYDKLIEKVKSKNAKTLGEVVSMKKGIEPGAEAYQDVGRLFIRVSSLSKYGIEDKDQKYLSDELYQKLKNNHEPKVGEILLTKDATPGTAYVVKGQIEGIISSGILRLKVKGKEVESEYLALCLSSVVGRMQAERDGGGSIITHWRPEQVKSVLVPILPKPTQQKIADLVQKSYEARKKAKELLEEAKKKVEEMIEGELVS